MRFTIQIVLALMLFSNVLADDTWERTGSLWDRTGSLWIREAAASGWTDPFSPAGLYWMETTNGAPTIADGSGNGLTGTNMPTPATGVSFTTIGTRVAGGDETAATFDGIDDYFDLGNSAQFNFSFNMTISCWLKAGIIGNDHLVSKDDNIAAGRNYSLQARAGRLPRLQVFKDNGALTSLTSLNAMPQDEWTHLVGTYEYVTDGTSIMRLYTNGVLDYAISNAVGPIQVGTAHLNIGRREYAGAESYFAGMLDDVRLYGSTLSATNVWEIYNNTGSTNHPTLSIEIREEL